MIEREAYQQKLETQLDEWRARVDKLEAKASQVSADARIEYNEQLQDLKAKQAAAKSKLEELKGASNDAWDDLKLGVDEAWDNLSHSVSDAAARFK